MRHLIVEVDCCSLAGREASDHVRPLYWFQSSVSIFEVISKIQNLKKVAAFDTVDMRVCTNCNVTSPGNTNEGRKIFSCHIDTSNDAYNNTNDMARSNKSSMIMRCPQCKMNDAKDGVAHTATEFVTKLPQVLLVSVNRFTNTAQGIKLGTNVNPSSIIVLEEDGQENFFYLKSVIQHLGLTINAGHYKTALNMEGRWLVVNDSKFEVESADPLDG